MSQTVAGESETVSQAKLPRRDWILLPLLSLLTILLLAGGTELMARRFFPETRSTLPNCMIENDASTGVRAVPNSVCFEDGFESGRVEYRFNGCGHRAEMACGAKTPGSYRIVMIGTSTAFGTLVPREQTLAARLPAELSRQTGRKVELYNEALPWETPRVAALRFNGVLAAQPDLILWMVMPWDIKNAAMLQPVSEAPAAGGFLHRARKLAKSTRTRALLEYSLSQMPGASVRPYMMGIGGPEFLGANLSAEWRRGLAGFDGYAAEIEARARAANIPLVAVFVPQRAQAAMISTGQWPPGYDPYKLSDALRSILVSHGGIYLDILPGFRPIPNPEQGYFAVDGHPNAAGHALLAKLIAGAMTGSEAAALQAEFAPRAADGAGRQLIDPALNECIKISHSFRKNAE